MTAYEQIKQRRKEKAELIRNIRRVFRQNSNKETGIQRTNKLTRQWANNQFGETPKPTVFQSCNLDRTEYGDHCVASYSYDDEGGGRALYLLDGPYVEMTDEEIGCEFGTAYYYGGPGRRFGQGYISRSEHSVLVENTWGLDI